MSNPMNGLVSNSSLVEAKQLVTQYREGREPPGTTEIQVMMRTMIMMMLVMIVSQVRRAMQLYKSAFHPDSGELQNVFGRMSFQVPGGMLITGAMLQWYRSTPQVQLDSNLILTFLTPGHMKVVFWQWFNQSFNALVNYTNRNASAPTNTSQLATAYFSATFSALGTAIGLKAALAKSSSSLIQRFVPFAAVAAANCVNIPLMRQQELMEGMTLTDEKGEVACLSKSCAKDGISKVVMSRISMAAPGMFALPVIMERMERLSWFRSRPSLHPPFQVMGVGCFLLFMVPTACSIWPQTMTVTSEHLR